MRSIVFVALVVVVGCRQPPDVNVFNDIIVQCDTATDTDTIETDTNDTVDTDVVDTDIDIGDTDSDSGDTDLDTDTTDTGQELLAYTCTPITTGEQDPKYIKAASLTTVYYVDPNCFRHAFPLTQVFFTWEDSFDGVVTVSDSDVAALVLGGNMPFKPGVVLLKIQSDPKVYAVTVNPDFAYSPILRWIETEQLATDIYGQTWSQYVVDVPDVFFTDYVIGESVNEISDLPGVDLNLMKTRVQLGL